MKLSFGTHINDKPNYFIEKIWKGLTALSSYMERDYDRYQQRHIEKFDRNWEGDTYTEFLEPKLHTIRKDREDIWHEGAEIAMVVYENTADEFQFAPALRCVSIQQIDIDTTGTHSSIRIDGDLLDQEQMEQLATNDGFHAAEELITYFNGDFNGKLIHWTAKKY